MTSPTHSRLFGITAASFLAFAVLGSTPTASAAPNTPTSPLCPIRYPVPDDRQVTAVSEVSVGPGNPGAFLLTVHTDSKSAAGYDQRFSLSWNNLDTSESGKIQTGYIRVQGADNVLTLPEVETGPGKIFLELSAQNQGIGEYSDKRTEGGCFTEYTVA